MNDSEAALTDTIFSRPRPMDRRAYLSNCVRISLIKRKEWVVAALLGTLILSIVLGLSPLEMGLLPLTVAGLVVANIVLDSWRRHSRDL